MGETLCVRLPNLFDDQRDAGWQVAKFLWPGHGKRPTCHWQPLDYPLTQKEADNFLSLINGLNNDDLDVLRHNLIMPCDDIWLQNERADLAKFAGFAPEKDSYESLRVLAQKILLWHWHMENLVHNIAKLEKACQQAENNLPRVFSEAPTEIDDNLPDIELPRIGSGWKSCVANACVFIPAELPILAEGEFWQDLLETHGEPHDTADEFAGRKVYRIVAPLWRVLGRKRAFATADVKINEIFNVTRIWLGQNA